MRIIVAGGRDFRYRDIAFVCLAKHVKQGDTVISGHARGADIIGEMYARTHNIDLELHSADWNRYGKAAGRIRNSQMADVADKLIAFWDGKSRGTKHMISEAKKKGLELIVYDYYGGILETSANKGSQ